MIAVLPNLPEQPTYRGWGKHAYGRLDLTSGQTADTKLDLEIYK